MVCTLTTALLTISALMVPWGRFQNSGTVFPDRASVTKIAVNPIIASLQKWRKCQTLFKTIPLDPNWTVASKLSAPKQVISTAKPTFLYTSVTGSWEENCRDAHLPFQFSAFGLQNALAKGSFRVKPLQMQLANMSNKYAILPALDHHDKLPK